LVSVLVTYAVYAGELAALGALLAMLSYLQSLAATRLLDADLAVRCAKVSAQLFGGGIVCLALDVVATFITATAWLRGHGMVLGLAILYVLAAVLRFVGILIQFRGTLHRQLGLAREAWSTATKPTATMGVT
jgi:hypothetical protein